MICRREGFSLLELSVVIAIIALVAAFGVGLGGNAMKAADQVNVKQRLTVLNNAIESFVAANGYLPCPASRASTPTDDPNNFGVEARTGTTCASSGIDNYSGTVYIGMVPVRTLGLPDSYAADVWGRKFTYGVSAPHVASAASYNANDGTIMIKTGDRTGVNYPISSTVTDRSAPNTASKITYGTGATYVVLSHGRNGVGATPLKSTVTPSCDYYGTQNDNENCIVDNVFWDTTFNDSPTNPNQFFDDYIMWGSNSRVRAPITTTQPGCVTGCEAWCAPCSGVTPNIPAGAPTALTAPTLCQKIITSASPCTATCVWSGRYTVGNNLVRCP